MAYKNPEDQKRYRKTHAYEKYLANIRYAQNNPEKIKEWSKKTYEKNKYKYKKVSELYRKQNIKKICAYKKLYYAKNREKISALAHIRYNKNKEKNKIKSHKYYLLNKDKIKRRTNEYRKNHLQIYRKSTALWKNKHKEDIRKYKLNRYHTIEKYNPNFMILKRMRGRLRDALKAKGIRKTVHAKDLTGLNDIELKAYLESTFKPGMNWELGRKIHIDHILPCDSFNLNNKTDLQKCFHYTNLQMLWAEENCKKGNKIVL